ncbi:uncharacterized protein LOC111031508 isoform X2 [Myzus persicae]|uniref:uncharacterized protein LOC111031508 isoform X2 n=1 Tax=Myzus persicae TaxID=13164 RepID=UPI000B938215|nr:uncharacterized protein LOC111031508 isoform X2 [Myzus persicae]
MSFVKNNNGLFKMMFSKQSTIILSVFVIFSSVRLINCADPDPADVTAKPSGSDAASNVDANNPKPDQAVNIVPKPTTTQQSSTTPMNGFSRNTFCHMISMPFNACRTFFGDAIRSFWKSFLKVKDNIISIYRRPVTTVNNVGG